MGIGSRIESLAIYGFDPGEKLSDDERRAICEWTKRFEECNHSIDELQAMNDTDLVNVSYRAMADYASGQL